MPPEKSNKRNPLIPVLIHQNLRNPNPNSSQTNNNPALQSILNWTCININGSSKNHEKSRDLNQNPPELRQNAKRKLELRSCCRMLEMISYKLQCNKKQSWIGEKNEEIWDLKKRTLASFVGRDRYRLLREINRGNELRSIYRRKGKQR